MFSALTGTTNPQKDPSQSKAIKNILMGRLGIFIFT